MDSAVPSQLCMCGSPSAGASYQRHTNGTTHGALLSSSLMVHPISKSNMKFDQMPATYIHHHYCDVIWCHVRFQPGFRNCHWFWVQRNSASIEDICGQPVKKWFVNPICQLVQHIFHRVLVRVRVEARPQADWLLLVTSKADSNRKKCKASISKVLSWPKVKKGLILYWGWLCATPKPGENGWST